MLATRPTSSSNFQTGTINRKRGGESAMVSMKRQKVTGYGTGAMTQVVPSTAVDRKTGKTGGGYTTLSRRNSTNYYYDKWKIFDTRTDPVYPQPQIKEFDVNIGFLDPPSLISIPITGLFQNLNTIPRGEDEQERVGSVIQMKSIYYQMVLNLGTVDPSVPTAFRHLLVYDRQCNQANPTIGVLLANPSNPVTSPLNNNYKARFIVIADDRTTLSPQGDVIRYMSGFHKCNQRALFGDATNEPVSGGIFSFFVSDRPAGTSAPLLYGTWRLKYFDN